MRTVSNKASNYLQNSGSHLLLLVMHGGLLLVRHLGLLVIVLLWLLLDVLVHLLLLRLLLVVVLLGLLRRLGRLGGGLVLHLHASER